MRTLLLALSAACLLVASASAQTETSPQPAAADVKPMPTDAKPSSPDDKQVVCIDQDLTSYSRLQPRRICHTKEEWNKLAGKGK
jgi:hypothetical protein